MATYAEYGSMADTEIAELKDRTEELVDLYATATRMIGDLTADNSRLQALLVDPFVLGVTKPQPGVNVGNRRDRQTLQPHTGDFVVTSDGQVVEGLDISGCINWGNYGGTLRDCVIRMGPVPKPGKDHVGVQCFGEPTTPRLIEFCDIEPSHPSVDTYGVHGWGYTLSRSVISGVVDGANIHRSPTGKVHSAQLLGNHITNLWYPKDPRQTDGSHSDGSQVFSGSDVLIQGNVFIGPPRHGNGVVLSPNSTTGPAKLSGVRIVDNWFEGFYTQVSAWDPSGKFDPVPGLVITGNRHGATPNSTTGDHRWDVLITQRNYDQAVSVSGNIRDVKPAVVIPYINK